MELFNLYKQGMKLKLKLSQNAAQKSYNMFYIKLKLFTKKKRRKQSKDKNKYIRLI